MITVPVRYKDAIVRKTNNQGWSPLLHQISVEYLTGFPQYSAQGKAPFFAGVAGTGKTYAAAALINTLTHITENKGLESFDYVWAPVGEMFDKLLAERDYKTDFYWNLDYKLKNSAIVVFDDFAHLRDYSRLREMFWIYVNARYDRLLPTIFTANTNMDKGWEVLDETFGDALRRRVQTMSEGLVAII